MDTAVGLVQAYLRVNGYFTVAEYPVLDATGPGGPRTITDLDILAVRLHRAPGASGTVDAPLDPALGAGGGADMIVGEVKEGRPHPNPAMRDPAVLEAAFTRFGCCAPTDAARLVAELLETGRTVAPEGHTIRTVVFGNPTSPPGAGAPWHTVHISGGIGGRNDCGGGHDSARLALFQTQRTHRKQPRDDRGHRGQVEPQGTPGPECPPSRHHLVHRRRPFLDHAQHTPGG